MTKKRIKIACPHCSQPLPAQWLMQIGAAIAASLRKRNSGYRKPVLRPCEHCGQKFGTVELRRHKPKCDKNPRNKEN